MSDQSDIQNNLGVSSGLRVVQPLPPLTPTPVAPPAYAALPQALVLQGKPYSHRRAGDPLAQWQFHSRTTVTPFSVPFTHQRGTTPAEQHRRVGEDRRHGARRLKTDRRSAT